MRTAIRDFSIIVDVVNTGASPLLGTSTVTLMINARPHEIVLSLEGAAPVISFDARTFLIEHGYDPTQPPLAPPPIDGLIHPLYGAPYSLPPFPEVEIDMSQYGLPNIPVGGILSAAARAEVVKVQQRRDAAAFSPIVGVLRSLGAPAKIAPHSTIRVEARRRVRASSIVVVDSVATSDASLVATCRLIVDPQVRWLIGDVGGALLDAA